MEVQNYSLSIASFPRMNYACKNSLEIYKKYKSLSDLFTEQAADIMTYHEVALYFLKKQTESRFPAELMDVTGLQNIPPADITTCDNASTFLKEHPQQKGTIAVIVLDISLLGEIAEMKNGPDLFVFMTSGLPESPDLKNDYCLVTSKDRVKTDVCNRLEKLVLKPMNEICAFLQEVITPFTSFPPDSRKQTNARNFRMPESSAVTQNNRWDLAVSDIRQRRMLESYDSETRHKRAITVKYTPLMKKENENMRTSSEMETGKKANIDTKKKKFVEKQFRDVRVLQDHELSRSASATEYSRNLELKDGEKVESLLKSINVLFRMSNIPENERPCILDNEGAELSEELCNDLFSISKYVKGTGYYSNTLRVLVSDQAVEETRVRENVEDVLKKHDVTRYEIVNVSEKIHNLMHVGGKLEPVSGYGTLGCFAKMDGEKRCILISGHVANCGRDMYFDNKRKVCRIIKETAVEMGELDIAAAEIYPEEYICSTEFKDSEGNPMKGKLREYVDNDKVFTQEQKVHIWGASSKPGKGVMKMPKVVLRDETCKQVLMQIEDGDMKFAAGGDSGAIVCADDPDGSYVHVLGMVMGEGLMSEDGQVYYYALPLSEGLKQLERKTNKKFELC